MPGQASGILGITSEVGRLRRVILHRPGLELERIVPEMLKEVLFEDIPWLRRMQEEHDAFGDILKTRGVIIHYVEDLLADVLAMAPVRQELVDAVIDKNPSSGDYIDGFLRDYLLGLAPSDLRDAFISGVLQKELDVLAREPVLSDYIHGSAPYDFVINPLPNLYFMRDPAVVIGQGMAISSMATVVRRRESLYMEAIFKHHPLFAPNGENQYYKHDDFFSLEGGDVLVLTPEVVAVGCSERTKVHGVERLAAALFEKRPEIQKVLAVKIPNNRAFMHLDTVFTMVDLDKFTVYPGILDAVETVIISRGKAGGLAYEPSGDLKQSLEASLKIPHIRLIESGGGNPVAAAREQWNDSTNTLAVAPGVVVAYSRNERSNAMLEKCGIEVIGIEASELVRGRGGPRCMTMPLCRDSVEI